MNTEYDIGLLNTFKEEITSGIVKIHDDSSSIIEEIEANLPFKYGRIDWNAWQFIYHLDLGDDNSQLPEKARAFLKKIENDFPALINEKIIVIGDNLTDLGYEMEFGDFLELQEAFISIPQHTYIWFPEAKKCINITFENELFFG